MLNFVTGIDDPKEIVAIALLAGGQASGRALAYELARMGCRGVPGITFVYEVFSRVASRYCPIPA